MGVQARLMSKAMRKLAGVMNRSDCTAIFINQLREKIGVMFGNPETTTGGKALKFYASIRIDVRKSEAIKNGTDIIGNKVNVKVVKNKVAPPFKTATVDIMYGKGISRMGELIELAVERDIVQKAGAWFSYKGEKIGQGKEAVRAFLTANPVIAETVEAELKQIMFAPSTDIVEE
jgi:recombination protein RecA